MKFKTVFSATTVLFLFISFTSFGQVKVTYDHVENQELADYFTLEGIHYIKFSFTDKELENKTYQFSVKEIWDGEIKKESVIVNSRAIGDTILNIRVIAKFAEDNKLRMDFHFPTHVTQRSFEATSSTFKGLTNNYVLRSVLDSKTVETGKKFYLFVNMLPYEVNIEGVGIMQKYCAVIDSGKEIDTWGREFGIKHYLVFEMIFNSL